MPDVRRIGDNQLILSLRRSVHGNQTLQTDRSRQTLRPCSRLPRHFWQPPGLRAHIRAGHFRVLIQLGDGNPDPRQLPQQRSNTSTLPRKAFLRRIPGRAGCRSSKAQGIFLPSSPYPAAGSASSPLTANGSPMNSCVPVICCSGTRDARSSTSLKYASHWLSCRCAATPSSVRCDRAPPYSNKAFRVDCRVGNPRVGKHLFSDADHFL